MNVKDRFSPSMYIGLYIEFLKWNISTTDFNIENHLQGASYPMFQD